MWIIYHQTLVVYINKNISLPVIISRYIQIQFNEEKIKRRGVRTKEI
jgi:hypothetical protein